MDNFEKAMLDPTSIYRFPVEVVNDATLTRKQKISILKQWQYDAHELQTADEENMSETGVEAGSMLNRVLTALHDLGE